MTIDDVSLKDCRGQPPSHPNRCVEMVLSHVCDSAGVGAASNEPDPHLSRVSLLLLALLEMVGDRYHRDSAFGHGIWRSAGHVGPRAIELICEKPAIALLVGEEYDTIDRDPIDDPLEFPACAGVIRREA